MGESERYAAVIRNAGYFVRHYRRNKLRQDQAILMLGLAVREAFNNCNDFRTLLEAFADSVRPQEHQPF